MLSLPDRAIVALVEEYDGVLNKGWVDRTGLCPETKPSSRDDYKNGSRSQILTRGRSRNGQLNRQRTSMKENNRDAEGVGLAVASDWKA